MLTPSQIEYLTELAQTKDTAKIHEAASDFTKTQPVNKLLGRTLLHQVALTGQVELYESLVACRLKDDAPDSQGETPNSLILRWKPSMRTACLLNVGCGEAISLSTSPYLYGRDKARVSYHDPEAGVSSRHMQIEQENGLYYITDLGSVNGTFLNDKKLVPHEKHQILNDDKIRICQKQYVFKFADQLQRPVFLVELDAASNPSGIKIKIGSYPFTFGREEYKVSHVIASPHISRTHMAVNYRSGQYVLNDCGSSNGTYLNGERLTPHKEYRLKHGDVIGIHLLQYRFMTNTDTG
jgi:pSer/pThr/pTyr-binding forkhead associated (FHA) protein